jgi:phosphoenolpyruvate-protein phosphotransferase (PTS system enzyme I)
VTAVFGRGTGVSSGIVFGRVHLVDGEMRAPTAEPLALTRVEGEVRRFLDAIDVAQRDLEAVGRQVGASLGESYTGIFQAQRLILQDPDFTGRIVERIRRDRLAAGGGGGEGVEGLNRRVNTLDDEYIRERGSELTDIRRRLDRLLADATATTPVPSGPTIIVARDLGPSDAFRLATADVVGLVVDLGGRTSHTAILAQALRLPAVFGLKDLSGRVRSGDPMVLDGDTGQVLVDPGPHELADAERRRTAWLDREARMVESGSLPAVTTDGVRVAIRSNIEFASEVGRALDHGAEGVGLYRSEFLFLSCASGLPTEEQHFATYVEIAERVAPHPATIRTLDLGRERYSQAVWEGGDSGRVAGARGVRFWLSRPDVLRPQLRALLRAAAGHPNLRAMLPVVASAVEVREVRRWFGEEAERLAAEGLPARPGIALGLMIEVPAAALAADLLAREADFFSIGTNDLVQYGLAIDRRSDALAQWLDPSHPGVLRMIDHVVRGAASAGIPVALCGEMAADPEHVGLLLGLGLRDLSVRPGAVGAVRDAVRGVRLADCERLARRALAGEALC